VLDPDKAPNDSAAESPPDAGAPTPPPTPPGPPGHSPESVSPMAVTRISGGSPRRAKLRGMDLPPSISAKLCIDEAGRVTSPEVLTQLPAPAAVEIADALRSWRYTPYKVDGVARAACFVVPVRVK
jgi:hypothetical protein